QISSLRAHLGQFQSPPLRCSDNPKNASDRLIFDHSYCRSIHSATSTLSRPIWPNSGDTGFRHPSQFFARLFPETQCCGPTARQLPSAGESTPRFHLCDQGTRANGAVHHRFHLPALRLTTVRKFFNSLRRTTVWRPADTWRRGRRTELLFHSF